ncbi:MAG TPA: zf-HC2 domain-containing protein [Acidimicrobiales bacterium]|nr:zf-HC2 domain-containing protein [Acidimicrobiales bacterium]
MTDPTCELTRVAATEYALGVLPPAERPRVANHLLECPDCRKEVDEIRAVGDRLLDLVPDAEPGLGFDRAVMARFGLHDQASRRRRAAPPRWAVAVVAAACIAAGIAIPLATTSGQRRPPARVEASLLDGGRPIGSVDVSGRPLWVYMEVKGEAGGGPVTCQLVRHGGALVTVGTFRLVDGAGSWGAPIPGAASQYSGARLVDPAGRVLARATF